MLWPAKEPMAPLASQHLRKPRFILPPPIHWPFIPSDPIPEPDDLSQALLPLARLLSHPASGAPGRDAGAGPDAADGRAAGGCGLALQEQRRAARYRMEIRRTGQRPALCHAQERCAAGAGFDPHPRRCRFAERTRRRTGLCASARASAVPPVEVPRQWRGDPDLAAARRELRQRYQCRDHADADGLQARPAQRDAGLARGKLQAAFGNGHGADAERGEHPYRGADRARRNARARRRRAACPGSDAAHVLRGPAAGGARPDRHCRDAQRRASGRRAGLPFALVSSRERRRHRRR